MCALRNAAQFVGKHVDELHPILEARLPDGSRVQAVIPPAATDGPYVSIRRFSQDTFTIGASDRARLADRRTPRTALAGVRAGQAEHDHRRRNRQRQDIAAQHADSLHSRRPTASS